MQVACISETEPDMYVLDFWKFGRNNAVWK